MQDNIIDNWLNKNGNKDKKEVLEKGTVEELKSETETIKYLIIEE